MSRFKEQIAADLDNILAIDEVSDDVTIGSVTGKAVFNYSGQSDVDWNGGNCISAVVVLPRSVFMTQPKINDKLITSSRTYYIAELTDESPVSWTIKVISELKAR